MRVSAAVVDLRRRRVAEYLQQHAYATLAEVCLQHDISEATARRDLAVLESKQQIVRTHGGALVDFGKRPFPSFRQRERASRSVKRYIASAAIKHIKPSQSIYLDFGTTAYAIADAMRYSMPRDLTVVTNSLPVAELLTASPAEGAPACRCILLGGEVLPTQSALVGERACRAVGEFEIDTAFISVEGADESGLWNTDADVVRFQRAVLEQSSRKILCLDRTKIGHAADAFFTSWDAFDALITDASKKIIRNYSTIGGTFV